MTFGKQIPLAKDSDMFITYIHTYMYVCLYVCYVW